MAANIWKVNDGNEFSDLSTPVIPHTGESITFIQGYVNQTIDCYSYSYPAPEFKWTITSPDNEVSTWYLFF